MKYLRLYKILAIFRAYNLLELLPQHAMSIRLKWLLLCLFWIRRKAKHKTIGERLCLALQELGPIWIKFGQMLSTRHDLLEPDIANPLRNLQDNVPPFDGNLAREIIEQALAEPLDRIFSDFDIKPLASASIAQVHTAILIKTGAKVVIKVLRPNIKTVIMADLTLMYWVARQIERRIVDGQRLRIYEVVQDYEKTILKELNLLQEAENTKRLRQNFINSDILYIPYVYRVLCRKNILVEEFVTGIPIADIDVLNQHNVNLRLLAERGVQAFFSQVFRDNFFHADMHPGNIFVDITEPANPRYIGIDCAIVGQLSREDQRFLAENFIAFFNRDYRKIAELYVLSGWVPESTDIFELELAMRHVCEPLFAKPLGEISFAQFLFKLFEIAREFNMEIQPQLVLLEKTLFYIEGLGRQLYPQLDLWQTAKPFLEDWYRQQMSVTMLSKQIVDSLPQWRDLFPQLPLKISQYERENQRLKRQMHELSRNVAYAKNQQTYVTVIATIVIIATFVVTLLI